MSEEIIQVKDEEVVKNVTRTTRVTDENVRSIAKLLIANKHPCLKSLSYSDENTLATILKRECIFNEVPLACVLQGAFRMDKDNLAVTYYGSMAMQMWQYIADQNNLPKIVGYDIKYVVNNLEFIVEAQKFYRAISCLQQFGGDALLKNVLENKMKELDIDKKVIANYSFATLNRCMVSGADECPEFPAELLVPKDSYTLGGAVGELFFNDNTPPFNFYFKIDPDKTALRNSARKTPYALHPMQMVRTKWLRQASKSFYESMGCYVPFGSSKNSADVVNRLDVMSNKASETAKRIDELKNQQQHNQ